MSVSARVLRRNRPIGPADIDEDVYCGTGWCWGAAGIALGPPVSSSRPQWGGMVPAHFATLTSPISPSQTHPEIVFYQLPGGP